MTTTYVAPVTDPKYFTPDGTVMQNKAQLTEYATLATATTIKAEPVLPTPLYEANIKTPAPSAALTALRAQRAAASKRASYALGSHVQNTSRAAVFTAAEAQSNPKIVYTDPVPAGPTTGVTGLTSSAAQICRLSKPESAITNRTRAALEISVKWRAAWMPTTTYAEYDAITYLGVLYYSLRGSNTNQNPVTATTYWSTWTPPASWAVLDTQPHSLVIVPAALTINESQTQTLTSHYLNVFGGALIVSPVITWSKTSGVGSVNSTTGVYTAPSNGTGTTVITATDSATGFTAAITITVV